MSEYEPRRSGSGRPPHPSPPSWASPGDLGGRIAAAIILCAILYAGYFWFIRRVVVEAGEVLVVMRKDGWRSLEGDQVVVPQPPPATASDAEKERWRRKYEGTNGILEQVQKPGVYFSFSPWDYERQVVKVVEVPPGKMGIVVRKFGEPLDSGQVLADPARHQRGPLPTVLHPGQYPEYSNPFAYEVKMVDPLQVEPGHRGVVTIMAGRTAADPNQYLVEDGEQGTQKQTEPEGFKYVNPFVRRVTPISIQSHRFEMTGADTIRFPSADSFEIRLEGFVEWSIIPDKLPLIYVQYAEGGGLVEFMENKVILPYSRSFCRLVGSQYTARDFISGDTKLKFQQEFEARLRKTCEQQGIEILQALVRDIVPPNEIKDPINEREIAKQQIKSLEQQILVAKSAAELARQQEMASQNQKIGDANKQVVTTVKRSEQERDVALTRAKQDLEVARLRLEAARQQADAQLARGQAEAQVILLNKQAEAEPLRQQVAAFGDGEAYARNFFLQKVAPSVKSILANTDGPFGELFKQYMTPKQKE